MRISDWSSDVCSSDLKAPSSALAGTSSRKREKGSSNLDHNRPMPTILVIDDNPSVATALDVLFSLHDIETMSAESPEAGLEQLQRGDVDLVIQDMKFDADKIGRASCRERVGPYV